MLSRIVKKFSGIKLDLAFRYVKLLAVPAFYQKKSPLQSYPTISIVTPSYNQGNFLEDTLCSVLGQQYPSLEYIVQDGGSSDPYTLKILEKYSSQLSYWDSRKDSGQSHALNLGFAHSKGDIMAYLNSDDMLLPGTLHYVAHFFATHPDVDVIYGHRVLINDMGDEVGRWVLPPHDDDMIRWVDYIPQETLFWRRSVWDKAGGYIDEDYQFAMDWELILRFLSASAKFYRVPRFLGAFRIHEAQKTSAKINNLGPFEVKKIRRGLHHQSISPLYAQRKVAGYLFKHVMVDKLYRLGILKY